MQVSISRTRVHRFGPGLLSARFQAIFAIGSVALLALPGCKRKVPEVVVLSSTMVEVAVRPAPLGNGSQVEWTVRHGGKDWAIRTQIPGLVGALSLDTAGARDALGRYFVWDPPHLFIREAHSRRDTARASVDHVFRCTNGVVTRLGTLACGPGGPGSQRDGDFFRDVYDRLEFSPLAAPEKGPTFPILMRDVYGRFRIDTAATWALSRNTFEARLADLGRTGPSEAVGNPKGPSANRAARSSALYCLALARYCERPREYETALAAARARVEDLAGLLEEVETVRPAELAASRDEVLRVNPALVNVFKESPDDEEEILLPSGSSEESLPVPTALP